MDSFRLPLEYLKREPIKFLETDCFSEMMSTYKTLKPKEMGEGWRFDKLLDKYDFWDIYPMIDEFANMHDISTKETIASVIQEKAPESVAFASELLKIFEESLEEKRDYEIVGNSPATYFICGVWANMKRGREFHPSSNTITVTYDKPDAYGTQNVRYRNKDYEMTLIFEAVEEYTKSLSWTAHRLLLYTLIRGNAQNWRNNTASFTISEYMKWAGLQSRDAAYRQLKKDVQSLTSVKITAESFKKYFESFHVTFLVTAAQVKKYTGEVNLCFAESVRRFLTSYYQLIPEWMGLLSENAYRMAFYIYYRARLASLNENGEFRIRVSDIIHYIGLPTKEEVKNRNYDEAIIRPFIKALKEIEEKAEGALQLSLQYSDINTFLAGWLTIRVDNRMREYLKEFDSKPPKNLPEEKPR